MDNNFYFYEPKNGHGLAHDPFKSIVGPRPIGWISTVSQDGVFNLAPYSFFNAFSHNPPILGFSSKGFKDTVKNIVDTRQFVWNLCNRHLVESMNKTSQAVNASIDEFALSNLTPVIGQQVKAPRVQESPVAFECEVIDVIAMTDCKKQPIDTWFVFGQVVGIHISKELLVNDVYNTAKACPVLRGGGAGDYFEITQAQLFQIERPTNF
jgi:flavin reductase (DIM6/NTAB) family NADH-FMN oxidoreductase RutF